MVFNFDKEENKNSNTNSDMEIVSNESKTKQLSELKNQLNKTKQTLDMNTKLQRYVVHSFNYEIQENFCIVYMPRNVLLVLKYYILSTVNP